MLIFVTSLGIIGLTSFSVTQRTTPDRHPAGPRRHALGDPALLPGRELARQPRRAWSLGVILTYALNFMLAQPRRRTPAGLDPGCRRSRSLIWLIGLIATTGDRRCAAPSSPPVVATQDGLTSDDVGPRTGSSGYRGGWTQHGPAGWPPHGIGLRGTRGPEPRIGEMPRTPGNARNAR